MVNNFNSASWLTMALFYILTIWTIIWKGIALWRASKNDQRNWFIALLIVNTFGILELVYLFRFAKKRLTLNEISSWFQSMFFTRIPDQKKKKSLK